MRCHCNCKEYGLFVKGLEEIRNKRFLDNNYRVFEVNQKKRFRDVRPFKAFSDKNRLK